MIARYFVLLGALFLFSTAHAGDWKFGGAVAYASGISDVADVYEENLEARPSVSEADITEIPIGLGFMSRYHGDSGVTFDIGIGPAFIIAGDAEHFEVPLYGTVGYRFGAGNSVTPYVRGGVAYHIVSGDFDNSSSVGGFAALGLEFGKGEGITWGVEVAYDASEIEFELPLGETEDVNTYAAMLMVFMLF